MDADPMKPTMPANKLSLAGFGAFGGALPTVVRLFELLNSPDAIRPTLKGYLSVDASLVLLAYLGSAAILAAIFPYPRRASPWLATSVGVAMPTLVGGMAAAAKHLGPTAAAFRGDDNVRPHVWQSIVDLLALF